MSAHPRRLPKSDQARVTPEKPVQDGGLSLTVGAWVRPSDADRELVRAGLERNGAHDLADALGLLDGEKSRRRLTSDAGPKTVPCPKCGVAAGQPCRTSTSGVLGGYHTARQEAA